MLIVLNYYLNHLVSLRLECLKLATGYTQVVDTNLLKQVAEDILNWVLMPVTQKNIKD